jgi:hypothetical protein
LFSAVNGDDLLLREFWTPNLASDLSTPASEQGAKFGLSDYDAILFRQGHPALKVHLVGIQQYPVNIEDHSQPCFCDV